LGFHLQQQQRFRHRDGIAKVSQQVMSMVFLPLTILPGAASVSDAAGGLTKRVSLYRVILLAPPFTF